MQDPTPRTDLSTAAQRHLWMHFTKLESFDQHEVPVITRGEGCYVYDQHGKRYLDGLSGLFTVQVGHGRKELAEAREQAAAIKLTWEKEKASLQKTRKLREEIEALRLEMEKAERAYDLNKVAELRHGKLPQLEAELLGGGFQHAHAFRNDLLADAVAGDHGDAIDAVGGGHGFLLRRIPERSWLQRAVNRPGRLTD